VGVWSRLSFASWAVGDRDGPDGEGGGELGMTGRPPRGLLLVGGRFETEYLEAPRLAAVVG
jgi:hypothetical protein